ncbi:MAG: TonB C-terminal domain-containing protein [Deltaproteobacteria bacterium]|nr:MAG: TonB C-terminal domain-containing protein [Deltaproteobacteria bacterium]TMQ04580.1 MAG: TonB C-terminal domain-containing protein [Deltaproteobacteria bacterium]
MSFSNGQMHGFALASTLVLSAVLFGGTLYLTEAAEAAHEPQLKEMMTIEASLARKSEKKRQPQKELKAPEPPVKPEGVSHDETKKPEKKPDKKDEKPKPDDKPVDITKFKHASDEDPQPGAKPITDIGQFDGSEIGFAPLNTGNPYWQHLVAEFHQVWEIPQISKVNGAAVGCFHIQPDGKIAGIKFETPSGDQTLDDSVQRALKATQKSRNDKPQPVPTEQLGVIKKWVCFRFTPNQ